MKVLVTGMSAQQANPASARKGVNFTSLIVEMIRGESGVTVDWRNPSVDDDDVALDRYDFVIVGVSPITSLGANRTYGALSTIAELWNDPRLTLLVDAPDPRKITGSLTAIRKKPENLLKKFFNYRLEYEKACQPGVRDRIHGAVDLLATDAWPVTIAPRLPWQTEQVINGLDGPLDVHLISPDALLMSALDADKATSNNYRVPAWAYETGTAHRWLRTQNVTWDTGLIARNARVDADRIAIAQLRQVAGCLIAPTKTGTWWSTRYAQALSQGTPVFSDWTESQVIGAPWAILPSAFELLSARERSQLWRPQCEAYLAAAGGVQENTERLEDALNSGRTTTT